MELNSEANKWSCMCETATWSQADRCHRFFFRQTIRRKRKVHVPMGRLGERETMSEHDEEEEDSYDEEIYETRSGRSGAYSGVGGAMGRRSGRSTGRRDRERERSGSRERSLSPRSDRRSHNLPPRPAKVTLVKSRKNEGEAHKVGDGRRERERKQPRSAERESAGRGGGAGGCSTAGTEAPFYLLIHYAFCNCRREQKLPAAAESEFTQGSLSKRAINLLKSQLLIPVRARPAGRVERSTAERSARANMLFVAVVHSVSRIWPAPGQPHLCQGHLSREPGRPRRQHPGGGRGAEGEEGVRG